MQPGRGWLLAAAAAGCFLLAALAFLPLSRLLRYATLGVSGRGAALLPVLAACLAAALVHERLVRGALYAVFGSRLPTGAAAPAVALLGAFLPAYLRLTLLPAGPAPPLVLAGHAYLVETGLGLGLCFLALGTGTTVAGGVALGAIWIARFGVDVTFHGGVVPLMELVAAWAAPLVAAAVLARPLAPFREELFG